MGDFWCLASCLARNLAHVMAIPGDACGRGTAAEFDATDLRRCAVVEAVTDKLLGAALYRPARGYPAIGGEGLCHWAQISNGSGEMVTGPALTSRQRQAAG